MRQDITALFSCLEDFLSVTLFNIVGIIHKNHVVLIYKYHVMITHKCQVDDKMATQSEKLTTSLL